MIRFRKRKSPVSAIGRYLLEIHKEGARRGYAFDQRKIVSTRSIRPIPAARGQLIFERDHLLAKLAIRDRKKYRELRMVKRLVPHPMFKIIPGGIEDWEKNASRTVGKGDGERPSRN